MKARGDKQAGWTGSKPGKRMAAKAVPSVAAVPTKPDWWDENQARLDREHKAREKEARKLGMSVGHLDALQEAWQKGHELKTLQAKYGDPDLAEQNCFELLDLVPQDAGAEGWTPDGLMNASARAAEKLLEMATSPQRDKRERERARANLCCLIEVIGRRAFNAFRCANKGRTDIAAQYLMDGLVTCCVLFREALEEGPERFKPWTRERFFLPSLRAYTAAFDDGFREIRRMTELAAATGVNLRGKARLNSPATLEVARAIEMIRWKAREQDFPRLTKDKASLDHWWDKGVKPWLEMKKERLLTDRRFENTAFSRARVKTKLHGEKLKWEQLLKDFRQSLKSLASPHPVESS